MVTEIFLNDYKLNVTNYSEQTKNDLLLFKIDFKVTSEDYHDVTTLLYKGTFDLKVPYQNIACRVTIEQYSTSVTNLYEKDQVGDFKLTLREIRE